MNSSRMIDQTWVRDWMSHSQSPEEIESNLRWFFSQDAKTKQAVIRLPILCCVRGDGTLEVPYYRTVGVVVSYLPDGRVGVKQSPDSEDVHYLNPDDLIYAGPWGRFTPDFFAGALTTKEHHEKLYSGGVR